MFLLACDNAMQRSFLGGHAPTLPAVRFQSVGDLAPMGLLLAVVVLHLVRHRAWGMPDRALGLILGSLAGVVVGAIAGLEFQISVLGLSTAPLLLLALMWLDASAPRLRTRALPERVWPINLDKKPRASDTARALGATKESR